MSGINTPPVASGLNSISNIGITAVTNIDVAGFDPALYDNYEVWIFNGSPANDAVGIEMETSTDGGTTFHVGASGYSWATTRNREDGTVSDIAAPDDTEIQLHGSGSVGFSANENTNFKISVFGPEATEFTTFTWMGTARDAATAFGLISGAGDRQNPAKVNALRFHWSAGNWAAQGNVQFLGIAQ